jgi:hypothetical protein
MFGRWGYFVGGELFGCYPLRPKEHDLWVRLGSVEQARALRASGVRPHRRFGARGWIELDVTEMDHVSQALRWLKRGHDHVRRQPGEPPRPAG